MLKHLRAHPARLSRIQSTGPLVAEKLNIDLSRAPVAFCWRACTPGGRRSKYCHVFTLERLQLVASPPPGRALRLSESPQFNLSTEDMRRLLIERAQAILPPLPGGYRWTGPELVHDTPRDAAAAMIGNAATGSATGAPPSQAVQTLARKVLRDLGAS